MSVYRKMGYAQPVIRPILDTQTGRYVARPSLRQPTHVCRHDVQVYMRDRDTAQENCLSRQSIN